MKIEEAVGCMSKTYLHRIIDSYTKDIKKPDDEVSRRMIISDSKLLSSPENIKTRLNLKNIFLTLKSSANSLLEFFWNVKIVRLMKIIFSMK